MTIASERQRSAQVRAIADQHTDERGPLLPILHEVMAEWGFIDRDDIFVIADVLNLSVAEVHGVVSFYKDFRTSPPPQHTVLLCRGEACQSVGSQQLFVGATTRSQSTTDIEVDEVFCLGNCALGPAGLVDGALHGLLNEDRLNELVPGWSA
jgi:formate dehydrogenase subunit gamma